MTIPVNPEILVWARQRAGYSIVEMSKQFAKIVEFENGESFPTISQLENLSKKYKIPLAVFFFSTPPKELSIETSLRAVSEEDVYNLSPHVRFLFRKAKAFQIYLQELLSDEQETQKNKLLWLTQADTSTITKLSEDVRVSLGITLDMQHQWSSIETALDEWRNALAKNGIFVFKDAFKDDNVSGFCIYDDYFPIIFLNNSLSKSRQIFTMFHELGHLIFKQNYLDTEKNIWNVDTTLSDTEKKCNSFAGNFLVPDIDFKKNYFCIKDETDIEGCITQLSNSYHVSREVILRKLLLNKLIQYGFFSEKMKVWAEEAYKKKGFFKSKSGGSYYNTKIQYLGLWYSSLVFSKYYQGKFDISTAAQYLDLKQSSFLKLEKTFLMKELS